MSNVSPAAIEISPAELLVTDQLRTRLARAGDLRGELEAFRELSILMTRDPIRAVQRFLELAIELCPSAGSSELSELQHAEDGDPIFHWTALAGELAPYVGGTTAEL